MDQDGAMVGQRWQAPDEEPKGESKAKLYKGQFFEKIRNGCGSGASQWKHFRAILQRNSLWLIA